MYITGLIIIYIIKAKALVNCFVALYCELKKCIASTRYVKCGLFETYRQYNFYLRLFGLFLKYLELVISDDMKMIIYILKL